ncbi:MAG TPA: 3-oxoacyl-ACP reductase [Lactovum miscens]|uniref:3-oxoacyl-ACP reductase n=1 Tax=Lactovum miscens TaxID=190387 RepID=UPI002EDA6C11
MRFSGQKVLVTGAASGIGKAQAQAFINEGAEVVAVDVHEADGIIKCDVSDPIQVKQMVNFVGEIDILCNTAGILDDYKTLDTTDYGLWKKVLETNLDSIYLTCSGFLPQMKKRGSGVIINMASVAGLVTGGGGLAYTTSKHAIVGFTKQLASDEARHGIQVLAIAPGAIKTSMTASDFDNDEKMAKKVAADIPSKRWSDPEEVAELTLFLASPAAKYMSGAVIPIDGGWSLGHMNY